MRIDPMRLLTLLLAGSLAATSFAQRQNKAASGDFEQQLRSQFTLAQTNRVKGQVSSAGTVVVIRHAGLNAAPPHPLNYINTFKDGARIAGAGFRENGWRSAGTLRPIAIGERFYVTRLEVKDDAVTFFLASCEQTAGKYYFAGVSFEFPKGYQRSIDFDSIQQAFSQVFTFEDPTNNAPQKADASVAGGPAPPAAQPPPPAFAPIEAPNGGDDTSLLDAPASAPQTLKLGLTIDQVTAILGTPKNIVDLGEKKIYVFQNLKVTFNAGKATNIE